MSLQTVEQEFVIRRGRYASERGIHSCGNVTISSRDKAQDKPLCKGAELE